MTVLLTVLLSFAPSIAHAYIDPGTGSMMIQIVIGAIAVGLGVIKLYWYRIKDFFGRGKSSEEGPDNPQ